jgi:uridine nucleosidase
MIPINVTHTAIVTRAVHSQLLSTISGSPGLNENLPKAATNLRHTLSTLISFFANAYKSTFGFNDGPPLHDALTIAYVAHPELFKSKRYRVDVELNGTHSVGETIVDVWNYQGCGEETWGVGNKNCMVTQSVDVGDSKISDPWKADIIQVDGFFALLHDCVLRCDQVSPLNTKQQ